MAGALFGKLEIAGLDTTSLQADLSIMDILMDAGASLSQLDGNKGNIAVQRAPLKAFRVDASNCPDLFPIIAVLAAFFQGTSHIEGTVWRRGCLQLMLKVRWQGTVQVF